MEQANHDTTRLPTSALTHEPVTSSQSPTASTSRLLGYRRARSSIADDSVAAPSSSFSPTEDTTATTSGNATKPVAHTTPVSATAAEREPSTLSSATTTATTTVAAIGSQSPPPRRLSAGDGGTDDADHTSGVTPTLPLSSSASATTNSTCGPVVSAVVLLRDWGKYGRTERVGYHFRLFMNSFTGAAKDVTPVPLNMTDDAVDDDVTPQCTKTTDPKQSQNSSFGVARLLECVPTKPWHKLTPRQHAELQGAVQVFNEEADVTAVGTGVNKCHEPASLPLPLHPQTRLFFAYETTRVVLILDASPTLTTTFGESSHDTFGFTTPSTANGAVPCCPMDRFLQMMPTFWKALSQPIPSSQATTWQPELAVTVMAVYPRAAFTNGGTSSLDSTCERGVATTNCTSVLVRNYRIRSPADVDQLLVNLTTWCYQEVEPELASRLAHHSTVSSYQHDGVLPLYVSTWSDLVTAGQAAVSTLSSTGRPCIVVATDGRVVLTPPPLSTLGSDHDSTSSSTLILDDIPVTVLDLSKPSSRTVEHAVPTPSTVPTALESDHDDPSRYDTAATSWLNYDPDGGNFPLHLLDDDAEALYRITRSTGGAFFNQQLLVEAASCQAGQHRHALALDMFFSFRRHTIQPNAVQWYILFSLSPLSPILNDSWGSLVPPDYLMRRVSRVSSNKRQVLIESNIPLGRFAKFPGPPLPVMDYPDVWTLSSPTSDGSDVLAHKPRARTTFATYFINPVPIVEILLLRIRDGYRAKQCGYTSGVPSDNRVSIQFVLQVDFETTILYELSYQALHEHSSDLVGFATIKIELSGEACFVAMVKSDFVSGQSALDSRSSSENQRLSDRLCTHLSEMRKEDLLQSYLSPLKWTDQLASPNTPFVRRLGTLTFSQRRKHFSRDEFDCVCTGNMPWDDDGFLSEFRDTDFGLQQLTDAVADWSTQPIVNDRSFIRQTSDVDDIAGYCVVEIIPSSVVTRLCTIVLETFGGITASTRFALLALLKDVVRPLKSIQMLQQQIGKFLVGGTVRRKARLEQCFHHEVLESHHNYVSWELVNDNELLALLMRRRKEIGKFHLLESCDSRAVFAKLYESETSDNDKDPGNLAQYQLSVIADKVVLDFHMECESGAFFPFRALKSDQAQTKFHQLQYMLKKRDQECGTALRSRATLLRAFTRTSTTPDDAADVPFVSSVQQLLGYASKVSLRLRFFGPDSGATNDILESLTCDVLLSQSFGPKVARLPIDGYWFVAEYDKDTLSIVHLDHSECDKTSESGERQRTYRDLTFYTISVSDLYSRRDDVIDDCDFDADCVVEHLQVTDFCESIASAHQDCLAWAAFQALKIDRSDTSQVVNSFERSDFLEAIRNLDFIEVASTVTAGAGEDFQDGSKLLTLFESVLHPIPVAGDNDFMFYEPTGVSRLSSNWIEDDSSAHDSVNDDDMESEDERSHSSNGRDRAIESSSPRRLVPAPLFVRFLTDDNPAAANDGKVMQKLSKFSVLISVFKSSIIASSTVEIFSGFDSLHHSAAHELSSLMKASFAEHTLESLRHYGSSLKEDTIRLAKQCLRKSRDVVTSIMDIYFYVNRLDKMVAASKPEGASVEIDEGFNLFESELCSSEMIRLRKYTSSGDFFVDATSTDSVFLEYWCFLKCHRHLGVVSVEIHHPNGADQASHILNLIWKAISMGSRHVNQLLLLRKLHSGRSSSRFLIAPDIQNSSPTDGLDDSPFHDGIFECPIVYRASFPLYHRCAGNPGHVIRSLEATVLHILSVNNRRQVFVYKDESGSVFYMRLLTLAGEIEGDAQIEFVVQGISQPGPSITQQLRTLLQKRLLVIAVDMLSSVLTKNPQYHWRQHDIDFVRSYQTRWNELESDEAVPRNNETKTYAFPIAAYDPGMIILFFRQNLCGSTYFHPLSSTELSITNETLAVNPSDHGNLHFESSDLVFYYNTAPSKLDPDFQSESTLTSKGADYARQAGAGIAIVYISFVSIKGNRVENMNAAIAVEESSLDDDDSSGNARFHEVVDKSVQPSMATHADEFVQVTISNANLDSGVIHQWILLSMNQALLSWKIERHLERIQSCLIPYPFSSDPSAEATGSDKLCQGLPTLSNILESAETLPHPASLKLMYDGVIRSSSVATVALDLSERGVLDLLRSESKEKLILDKHYSLTILRSSRSTEPRQVHLERDQQRRVIVRDARDKTCLIDTPVDCPEYTIFFFSLDFTENNRHVTKKSFPKLFEEVTVGYAKSGDKGEYARSLFGFKSLHLKFFRRSFAFVVSIKRNRRKLLAYNWSSSLFKHISARLLEMENMTLKSVGESVASAQTRCLGKLAPYTCSPKATRSKSTMQRNVSSHTSVTTPSGDFGELEVPDVPRQHGYQLPPTIRRPKLVGKSVDGSAMQAVARSRARASSARFRGTSAQSIVPRQPGSITRGGCSPSPLVNSRKSQTIYEPAYSQVPVQHAIDTKMVDTIEQVELATRRKGMKRCIIDQSALFQTMTKYSWPSKAIASISLQHAEYILAHGSLLWSSVCEIPPFPQAHHTKFLNSLGQCLTVWTAGLKSLNVQSHRDKDATIILVGKSRNLFSFKGKVAVKLSVVTLLLHGRRQMVVCSEGRILTFPRRGKKFGQSVTSQSVVEYCSAGLDKLASDHQGDVDIQANLLDHAAWSVEQIMKSHTGSGVDIYREAFTTLQRLVRLFPQNTMMKSQMTKYNFYSATIVLRSYGDKLIDLFDGPALFGWLARNEARTNLTTCGDSLGLYFKKYIRVGGTKSVCFLSCINREAGKMRILILCRTRGENLREFMFRKSSNVAISIMGNIAVEAACLAFKELRWAAENLRRKQLWTLLTAPSTLTQKPPSVVELVSSTGQGDELLFLCKVTPLAMFLEQHKSFPSHLLLSSILCDTSPLIDPISVLRGMQDDAMLSPFVEWSKNGCDRQFLFYVDSSDIFLHVTFVDRAWNIALVEQDERSENHQCISALQKLTNFLLHMIWYDTSQPSVPTNGTLGRCTP